MDLNFIPEDIPTVVRVGGEGRKPTEWENELAPLKEHQGRSFRVWTYGKRTAATSRAAAVRARIIATTPSDNWTYAVREVEVDGHPQFGVYLRFNGNYSSDEVAANAAKRAERSAKIKAQREAKAASEPAVAAESTPAEKVAAARRGRATAA